jgi:hypothetical protein
MKKTCALLLLACAGSSLAQDAAQGEKWRITTSMQMAGMSMPGMSTEICKQPGDDSAPVRTEENCEIYDMQRNGNVQSFKMRCTGRNEMHGVAQLTYQGEDRYQGRMEMTTQGQTMVMNYEGRKVGRCDGGEINLQARRMVAEGERQQQLADQQLKESCRNLAAKAEGPAFFSMCKDPADKQTYCEAVRKPENFQRLSEQEQRYLRDTPNDTSVYARPLTESARICGFVVEREREGMCALADQSGNLDFIASQCPTQAAGIAATHCAGRRYTAIAERYRNFCSRFASNQAQQQQQADQPATPMERTKGLFNKGKKALGGLLSN